jgi:hypothetical protein
MGDANGPPAVRAAVDIDFACEEVVADRYAAAPTALLKMRAVEASGTRVYAVALRCQVRIEPLRRHYSDDEADKVVDLFGERSRWGSTMQPIQLAFLSHVLPGFARECSFELALPLSYDVDVAAHKYLAGVEGGEIPLVLLFSGQVFTGSAGSMSVEPVPWHKETTARMPVSVWREAMDAHFPNQAWLRVSRTTFDRLGVYRGRRGHLGWDQALNTLLDEADQ